MALAIEYEADVVSFNTRHYGTGDASRGGIQVRTPDDALMQLAGLDRDAVLGAVRASFGRMRNPAPDRDRYVGRLDQDGLTRFADWLRDVGWP